MNKSLRLLLLLSIMGVTITACGAPTPAPTAAPAPTKAEAAAPTQAPPSTQAPAQENVVRIALIDPCGEKNSLDPINQPGGECSVMVNQVYNRLLDLDSNFVVHPELAESFESNAEATEWTFHLRKGVKFHDGHELTSKDVVWTFKRLIDPKAGSEAAAMLAFLKPEGIIAVDDYTVKFVVDKPVPELPNLISIKNTWIVPDGATEETLRLKGDGTGPFIAVDFQPVQQPHVFVRNPNYWEAGLPKADRLEFYEIPEATTRNAAIQSGQVDIVQNVDFATIGTLKNDPNIKLLETGASTSLTLSMWVDKAPFNDLRVRQALKKLVDRKAMLATALMGYGEIGDDNPIPPSSPYAWRTQVPDRDLEGAKRLLAEAGYGPDKPLKVDLYTSDTLPGMLPMAQLFKEQAAEAGVEVNLIVGPASEHWDNVWLKQPFVTSGWTMRGPGDGLAIAYRSNSQYPETHWFRKDYDAILDQANTTVDPKARADLYKKAEQMLTEEGGAIIPLFTHTIAAIRTNCEGYQPHVQISRFDARNCFCKR